MKISEMNGQQREGYLATDDRKVLPLPQQGIFKACTDDRMVLPLPQQGIFKACITGDLNENQ